MTKTPLSDIQRRRRRSHDLRALARSFPTLSETPSEFFAIGEDQLGFTDGGADQFARWARPMSGGEKDAALFVLSVWNSGTDWGERCGLRRGHDDDPMSGRFDVHRALGNWDPGHRDAFLAWARAPWWM